MIIFRRRVTAKIVAPSETDVGAVSFVMHTLEYFHNSFSTFLFDGVTLERLCYFRHLIFFLMARVLLCRSFVGCDWLQQFISFPKLMVLRSRFISSNSNHYLAAARHLSNCFTLELENRVGVNSSFEVWLTKFSVWISSPRPQQTFLVLCDSKWPSYAHINYVIKCF